jgi:hypothetical protein
MHIIKFNNYRVDENTQLVGQTYRLGSKQVLLLLLIDMHICAHQIQTPN